MKKGRNSNIELLRILCMIAIIIHHSFVHSGISISIENTNTLILSIIQILGKTANNIFILTTGYYMINKKINKEKIIKLIGEILFYSYSILFVYLVFCKEKEIGIIIKSILPITFNAEWFVTSYILLYITIPFINALINNLTKKEMSVLIIIFIVCFSILPTINLLSEYFSNYIWFILLYLVGAYTKLYENKEFSKYSKCFIVVSSIAIICVITSIACFNMRRLGLLEINSFLVFILAYSIFMDFINKKEYSNSIINYVASSSLGIYLIHDNVIIRALMWKKLKMGSLIKTKLFWLYEIEVVVGIFIICLLIDIIRRELIEEKIIKSIRKNSV